MLDKKIGDKSLCVLRDNGNVNRIYYRDERSEWQGNIGTHDEMVYVSHKRKVLRKLMTSHKILGDNEWNGKSRHWYWAWNHYKKKMEMKYSITVDNGGKYFKSKDDLRKVLNIIGYDDYKKYVLGVKD